MIVLYYFILYLIHVTVVFFDFFKKIYNKLWYNICINCKLGLNIRKSLIFRKLFQISGLKFFVHNIIIIIGIPIRIILFMNINNLNFLIVFNIF